MNDHYERTIEESRQLAQRMRSTHTSTQMEPARHCYFTQKMHPHIAWTVMNNAHLALERFQKDFASYEKMRREDDKTRRQS